MKATLAPLAALLALALAPQEPAPPPVAPAPFAPLDPFGIDPRLDPAEEAAQLARACGDAATRNALLRAMLELELDDGPCPGQVLRTVDRRRVQRMRSDELAEGLPGLAVFELWILSQGYPGGPRVLGLPGPMPVTVALDPASGERWLLWRSGRQEAFAALLAARGQRLAGLADAERLSALRAALGCRHGQGEPRRVDATTWRLDERESDGYRSWYELRTDAEGRVLSGELRHERTR